jgi:hypothetical protein
MSKPKGLVRLEGLGKLKKKKKLIISSGLETATFRLAAQRLDQLRYCVRLFRYLTGAESVITEV